ncbi:MAG: hypothetical protein Q7R49_01490 [Candidatus Daviesbacteria bacterium]|nr:hypothetical protein [Candidatus Daviesbacteria bacterium]
MVDDLAEKGKFIPEHIDSAFDLSSGGMGIHLHSLDAFAQRRELPGYAKGSLTQPNSNYLVNPYIFGWTWKEGDPSIYKEFGPYARSPYSEQNVKLLEETHNEYKRLGKIQLRLLLGGEEALSVANPEAPITERGEFIGLLSTAKERGLIEADQQTLAEVGVTDNDFQLAVNLAKAKVKLNDSLWSTWDEIKLSDRFRDRTLVAATHKLGAMLGLTEQLVYDAAALGVPIPPTYRPSDPDGKWAANWQKVFGEPIPDLEGLYTQAYNVFVQNADQKDPLVTHLFSLAQLPQLA